MSPENMSPELKEYLEKSQNWPDFCVVVYEKDKEPHESLNRDENAEALTQRIAHNMSLVKGKAVLASIIKSEIYKGPRKEDGLYATIYPDATIEYAE